MRSAILLAVLVAAAALVVVVESSGSPQMPTKQGGRQKGDKKAEKKAEKKTKVAPPLPPPSGTVVPPPPSGTDAVDIRSNANVISASTGDNAGCATFNPLLPKEANPNKQPKDSGATKEDKLKVCLHDKTGFLMSRKSMKRSKTLSNMIEDTAASDDTVVPLSADVLTPVGFRLAFLLARDAERAEAFNSEATAATEKQYAAIKKRLDTVARDATPGQGMDAVMEAYGALNFLDIPVVLDGTAKWFAKTIVEPNTNDPNKIRELLKLENDLTVEEKQQLATKYGFTLPQSELAPRATTSGGSTSSTAAGATSSTSTTTKKGKGKEKKDTKRKGK